MTRMARASATSTANSDTAYPSGTTSRLASSGETGGASSQAGSAWSCCSKLRHGTLRGIDTQNNPTVTPSSATIAAAAIASRFISNRVRSVWPVDNGQSDEATLGVLPAESPAKAPAGQVQQSLA